MPVVSATQRAILEAARFLEGGGVISFPTETVYGLGGDTLNKKAIQKIYSLKNRPSNNPLIAHVLNSSWAKQITCGWDEKCHLLAERFWPGPLTIVLPKANCVPKESCGGHNTIGVRSPNHKVARELLDKFGGPISAPSANKSGQTSPTSAEHVRDDFGNDLLILDGGNCDQGIESTVLSMVDCPTILRLGSIDVSAISEIVHTVVVSESNFQTDSPGTTNRHYSPKTKLVLQSPREIEASSSKEIVYLTIVSQPGCSMKTIQMPTDAQSYANRLYAAMREADSVGSTTICVERPPIGNEWDAINDRLRRASSN